MSRSIIIKSLEILLNPGPTHARTPKESWSRKAVYLTIVAMVQVTLHPFSSPRVRRALRTPYPTTIPTIWYSRLDCNKLHGPDAVILLKLLCHGCYFAPFAIQEE